MFASGEHRAERLATQQMHVQVVHHLPAVLVAVDYEPETVIGDAFGPGDVARHDEHVAQGAFVLVAYSVDGRDRLVRNDEYVHRCLRTDVAEGRDPVVLVHEGGGNFTRDDFLENGSHVSVDFHVAV